MSKIKCSKCGGNLLRLYEVTDDNFKYVCNECEHVEDADKVLYKHVNTKY